MLKTSTRVLRKLKEKNNFDWYEWYELEEAFWNSSGRFLEDTREENRTIPPTLWIISTTDDGRKIKIVFIEKVNGDLEIKSAYEPNELEVKIYDKYTKNS
ncbi:hypothetical protein [Silvanigrella aquatica]|uniref:ADP-ribosyl-(Dinitrogen reductase) hydrolase n=1 Tax=Silvanigrella aquatica TaxID=1915309 RepID=A0A1L4D0E6_9BACT|nr:hypothetical protein [Silvanigrella aquatica]APJ03664.1 hypothetical protein AXG55_06985 [Silvanigrella aquatica]